MRLRLGIAVGFPGLLTAIVLGATPAVASEAPDYEMPFPCGQEWTGGSRPGHSPSPKSIDFNRPGDYGDLVVSSAPGVVTRVADSGSRSYGKWVVVDHGEGQSSLYAHLKAQWVTVGQPLDQGAVLGVVGDTGGVSGAHLHFEQRSGNTVVDPYFHQVAFKAGTTAASENCPDVPLAGSWDHGSANAVAVFRRTAGSGTFELAGPETIITVPFGRGSDAPVVGDWDGDGLTDVGVRRQKNRKFFLRHGDGAVSRARFGRISDLPVTGDWNGDGVTEIGVWRPRAAKFFLRHADGTRQRVRLGSVGSQPVTGDWDGDGVTDLGVFDAGTATFTLRTLDGAGSRVLQSVVFGAAGDLPVTGDWNGDGLTDVGTWAPDSATFSLRTATAPTRTRARVRTMVFGQPRF